MPVGVCEGVGVSVGVCVNVGVAVLRIGVLVGCVGHRVGLGKLTVGNRGSVNGIGPHGTNADQQARGGGIVAMAIKPVLLSVAVYDGVNVAVA